MKIVLDAYGGDNSPHEIVKGGIEALNLYKELSLIMTGNEDELKEILSLYKYDKERLEIVDAKEIISNNESPTMAIKTKKDSSMVRAFDITKNRDDVVGMVTAGSTGAALTGGIFKIGRAKGVARPSLVPILPTITGGHVCLADCGANVDCKSEYLAQFAIMGCAYMSSVYGIENPRVALVSVGVEDKKGNELTHEAFKLLKEMPINFVGNMEARDALSGEYDVLVCDGFVGNVLLKSTEGTLSLFMKLMKKAMMTNLKSKIGALLVKKQLKNMINDLGINDNGGAAFLGINKLLLKSHGSSKANEIRASIKQVMAMAEVDLVGKINKGFAEFNEKKAEQESNNNSTEG